MGRTAQLSWIVIVGVLFVTNGLEIPGPAASPARCEAAAIVSASRDVVVSGRGEIYVTGVFDGTADFDPGVAGDLRTAVGGFDIFVTKYDAEGEYLWTRTFGADADDATDGIDVSENGEVTVHGRLGCEPFEARFQDFGLGRRHAAG